MQILAIFHYIYYSYPTMARNTLAYLTLLLGIVGCSSTPSVYRKENFDVESQFSRRFSAPPASACQAARLALLDAGYLIQNVDERDPDAVKATKDYQPDDKHNNVLHFTVRCVENPDRGATVYATAQEVVNELQTSRQTSNIGISAVGSLGIPISATQSSVKIKSETIQDTTFYKRFFDNIGSHLRSSQQERYELRP